MKTCEQDDLCISDYILKASSPSDKCTSPCPSLNVETISGAYVNSLCSVGENLGRGITYN